METSKVSAGDVLDWLHSVGSDEERAKLARYGIPDDRAVGVAMGVMKKKAKALGTDHDVALELWDSGLYEGRTMAVFLADPDEMTEAQADAWCAEFDNWAICDTACFSLLDRTPFAWRKVGEWSADQREFVRRAGFALIWALTVHDKGAPDAKFIETFELMRDAAADERKLVKKAINMALRAVGKRNEALNQSACAFAAELAENADKNAAWIGSHALRELQSDKVRSKFN